MKNKLFSVMVYQTYSERTLTALKVKAENKEEAYKKVLEKIEFENKKLGFEYYSEFKRGKEIVHKNGAISHDYTQMEPVIYEIKYLE